MVCYICAITLSVRECSDISYAVSRTSVMGKVSIRCGNNSSSSDTSAGQRFQPHKCHNRTRRYQGQGTSHSLSLCLCPGAVEVGSFFRVSSGVHDSYTFQCGLVGSFTSPGIDTR